MDGIHDMGGMQGFGHVKPDTDTSNYVEEPGSRILGVDQASTKPIEIDLARWRYLIECMPPSEYLTTPYYSRWYTAVAIFYLSAGIVTLNELATGKSECAYDIKPKPSGPETVSKAIHYINSTEVASKGNEKFHQNEAVMVRNSSCIGHTRLPRYTRGKIGNIDSFYGWHILPDSSANGENKAEPLYSVKFRASELWPNEGHINDSIYVDMWESYLEEYTIFK